MGDWACFIFKLKTSGKYYLINCGNEDKAWSHLASKLSRSIERTKKDCEFIDIMDCNDYIKVLK